MQQQKTSLRWFARTALMLVLMMLTATTAWAFKTETATYTVTYSSGTITIKNGSTTTASWSASNTLNNWKRGDSHNLANGMTIVTDADLTVNPALAQTTASTTFTFTAPSNTAITGVTFKMNNDNVAASSTSEPVTSFSVTVPAATGFSTFVVTFGYISGSCGGSATWSLSKENGQYTALTIGGSGAMSDYNGSNTPWDNDLTRVTVGSRVTSIGNNAFNGCSNLTRVDIQKTDGLVTLGSGALTGCNALAAIVAPTPALAVGYQTAMNWSAHASKLRVALGNYLFAATDEGGTAAYAITSETDLRNLAAAVNAKNYVKGLTFRQTAHITLNGDFTPIAYSSIETSKMKGGTFDGGGYVISGLAINSDGYVGLFGDVDDAIIKNVVLMNPIFTTINSTSAALIGMLDAGTVMNCYAYGTDRIIGRQQNNPTVTNVGRARKVTVGSGLASVTPAATDMDNGFVYNNESYYREGLELTLTATDELAAEAANLPTGYALTMMANGTATSSTTTYTVNSTDGDVTLTAAVRSTVEPVSVNYIDENGIEQTAQAIALDGSETTLAAGTYFVGLSEVNFYNTVTLGGNVTLILKDGCTMNVGSDGEGRINDKGISGKYNLDIYGQPQGTGALNVYTTGSDNYAIIIQMLTINGGNITANGTIGIGTVGGVAINGGIVRASGSDSNNGGGIIAYGSIYINGGNVNATGRYGIKSTSSSVNLGWTYGTDCIYASSYSSFSGISVQLGKKLIADDGTILTGTLIGTLTASDINGKTLRPFIALADYDDNTNVLKEGKDKTITVQLAHRTLYKDGDWNTLCLPFSLSEEQIAASPLNGATIKALDASASGLDNGTLTLAFTDVKSITAGQPYIIKWTTTGDNIVNPLFTGVTITSTTPEAITSTDGNVTFVGQYNFFYITEENINEIIMLSKGNKLGYSNILRMLRPFRCHFEVPASSGEQMARSFVMDFGGEETGIETTDYTNYSDAWYTIDGRKLDSVPTKKGLYIHKGKKVVKK